MVGAGDVWFVVLLRHYRHDVDCFDVYRAGPEGHVGALAVGLSDYSLLFSLHGKVDSS